MTRKFEGSWSVAEGQESLREADQVAEGQESLRKADQVADGQEGLNQVLEFDI